MDIADVIRVANKIRGIAQDPQHRPYIIRRGILPSIITFAQNEATEVRIIAMDILRILASHPDNKEPMSKEPSLISSVCAVMKGTEPGGLYEKEATLRSYSIEVLVALSDFLTEEQLQKEGVSLKEILVKTLRAKEQQLEQTSSKQNKKHNLVLEIDDLKRGEIVRAQLQKIILQIKGNISSTISIAERRVHLYTRAPTETIIKLFAEKGFTCQVKSDAICETEYRGATNSAQTAAASGSSANTSASAKTLNDMNKENYEPKKPASAQPEVKYLAPEVNKQEQAYRNSLMTYDDSSSYEAKLAAQRQKKKEKKEPEPAAEESSGVSRFFTKITSVFW